ncbi:hypothetical protein Pssp01_31500 [Pseudomonas sp. NBRC 100443]|nr:hypothetical protein Pssp01_31500 [Pseudomonas sp. NBRC 100443]
MAPNLQPAEDSPLSLQGEGWGEGALERNTYATGNPCSRASSLLRKAKKPKSPKAKAIPSALPPFPHWQ